MQFSIIIPTRNRPEIISIAIESVLKQTFTDFEIIIVNDGSDEKYHDAYQSLKAVFATKINFLTLEKSLRGHGPGFTRNVGALNAQGKYLCFLDDDDLWTDDNHLFRANHYLYTTKADVYLTKQQAYLDNQMIDDDIWLCGLENQLTIEKNTKIDEVFHVNFQSLIKINGFSHLNTIITNKRLYLEIQGIDESLWYEEDRDFYYRLIDKAEKILFFPGVVSRHNIPNHVKKNNVSTSINELNKKLFNLYSLNKIILFSQHREMQKFAEKQKIYTLKHISDILHKEENYKSAFFYAKEALLIGFNVKWLAFTGLLFLKSLTEFKWRDK